LPRRALIGVALPAAVASAPIVGEAVHLLVSGGPSLWLWGDQALIDIEARDSILGRNLLGVYDRYGWHHPGPLWLLILGVFRWVGGGSPTAVVIGSYALQVAAVAGIVVVVQRLRPGLTVWWAALLLIGYEWSYGPERFGIMWAPYAVALPAALLVLLVADVVTSPNPWGPFIATVICASFLIQTDISTALLVVVMVLAAPSLRWTLRRVMLARAGGTTTANRDRGTMESAGWGWSTGAWLRPAATLAGVVGVLWLAPVIQQLTTSPGNLTQVYRFLTTHHTYRSWRLSLRAADTVFGFFPFRLDELPATRDSRPTWLVAHSVTDHPWYLVYLALMVVAGGLALRYRQLPALALATASFLGMLAAFGSISLVYGPLYPYLVFWSGALVVPAWVTVWLALAPLAASVARKRAPASGRILLAGGEERLALPLAGLVAAAVLTTSFTAAPVPMTREPTLLARESWDAVAADALRPNVKTVYVDIVSQNAMPEAAAIADQVIRHGRQVEVNTGALYFLDPSLAHKTAAQLSITVCCGVGDPGRAPIGLRFSAKVGGQGIYSLADGPTLPGRQDRPDWRVRGLERRMALVHVHATSGRTRPHPLHGWPAWLTAKKVEQAVTLGQVVHRVVRFDGSWPVDRVRS
jgi:hypothetical protein